jgi:hypothetical protein
MRGGFNLVQKLEQNPSWEADSNSASQKIIHHLCSPKAHYRVNKNPPLLPIWARWIQSTPSHPIYLGSILILSSCLRLRIPSDLFPLGFSNKMLCLSLHACYMPRQRTLPLRPPSEVQCSYSRCFDPQCGWRLYPHLQWTYWCQRHCGRTGTKWDEAAPGNWKLR